MAKRHQYLQHLMMAETQDSTQHLPSPEPALAGKATAFKTLILILITLFISI